MDDVHGFGPDQQWRRSRRTWLCTFASLMAVFITKRVRKTVDSVTTIESKRKYLDAVLELLGLECAKDVPAPIVPGHKEQLVTGDLLGQAEIAVYWQCIGGLLYHTGQSRRAV